MVDTTIVPDSHIVSILPAVADLEVMVVDKQADKPIEQAPGLERRETINALHMVTDGENRFPACYGVRADDGVGGLQVFPDVLGSTARGGVEFETTIFGSFVEFGLGVSCCQGFKEPLIRS